MLRRGFLGEITLVGLTGLFHRGMDQVVGEEDVRNRVVIDEVNHILQEIATIHDMDFLKRREEVGGQRIAIAVLENQQTTVVAGGRRDTGGIGITAHEGAIGIAVAILIGAEEAESLRLTGRQEAFPSSAPDFLGLSFISDMGSRKI